MLLVTAPLQAQRLPPRLSGRVEDAITHQPVASVDVYSSGSIVATTDSSGAFSLPATHRPPLRLRFVRLGYELRDSTVTDASTPLLVMLVPAPLGVGSVSVERGAERSPAAEERQRFEREVIPRVVGIARAEIRALPAVGEPDVLRVLQALPGVVPVNDFATQLHVHGGGPDQNLFLLDGARVFAPYHLFGLAGACNPDAVRRVELFAGAVPARRGGALSSVVEVQQRDGVADSVFVEGGLSLVGVRAAVGGPTPAVAGTWMMAGRRSHVDLAKGGFPYSFSDFEGRVSLTPTEADRLGVSWFLSSDRFRWFVSSFGEGLHSRWSNAAGSAEWRRALAGGWSTLLGTWSSGYFGSIAVGDGDELPTSEARVRELGLRVEARREAKATSLRVGGELVRDRVELEGAQHAGGYLVGRSTGSSLTATGYVELDQRLGAVRLAPGLRVSHEVETRRNFIEPRVGLRMYLARSLSLTVGYNRTYQILSTLRDDRYLVPGAPLWFLRRGNDPASRADGATGELSWWLGTRYSVVASAYVRSYKAIPRWRPSGRRDLTELAYDDGSSRGLDLFVRRHSGRITGWLGYTWGEVRLDEAESGATYAPGWDRRRAVDASVAFQASPRLTLSSHLALGSGLPFWPATGAFDGYRLDTPQRRLAPGSAFPVWADEQARLPDYLRLDIGARYRFRAGSLDLEPFASVLNATNHYNVLFYRVGTDPAERARLYPENQLPWLPVLGLDVRF